MDMPKIDPIHKPDHPTQDQCKYFYFSSYSAYSKLFRSLLNRIVYHMKIFSRFVLILTFLTGILGCQATPYQKLGTTSAGDLNTDYVPPLIRELSTFFIPEQKSGHRIKVTL